MASISASNLETSFTCTHACGVTKPVRTAIPAKVLFQEIKALPSEIRDVELSVTTGKGNMRVSVNGRCSIHTMEAGEFPELPSGFETVTKVRNMKEATSRVITAVSRDETRYVLTGLFLDFEGGNAVGSDGYRMHHEVIEADGSPRPSIVIPANAIRTVLKFKGEDEVLFGPEGHVAFSVNGGLLTARLMDGNYPSYKEVIPKPEARVTFAASEFLKLIEGAVPMANQTIRLQVNGDLVISAAEALGRYEWRIPCTREGGDKELVYHFNPAFLVDAIKAFPADRVTLGTPDGAYGAVLVNGKAVVMPQRM
jgi:DNA polymerase-3 subunit beta